MLRPSRRGCCGQHAQEVTCKLGVKAVPDLLWAGCNDILQELRCQFTIITITNPPPVTILRMKTKGISVLITHDLAIPASK
jgi:hypothetical protein